MDRRPRFRRQLNFSPADRLAEHGQGEEKDLNGHDHQKDDQER